MSECSKTDLMRRIQRLDFALEETAMYLDGHPDCAEALEYYCKTNAALTAAVGEYEAAFGPLTIYGAGGSCWNWTTAPWPWECEGR